MIVGKEKKLRGWSTDYHAGHGHELYQVSEREEGNPATFVIGKNLADAGPTEKTPAQWFSRKLGK